jgi:DNA-directed RNA polymerase subunit beta
VTVLLRAMGYASDEEILNLFDNSLYIRLTLDADPEMVRSEEGALIELFKKQRPGEPPTSRASGATSSTRAWASTSTSRPAP